MVAIDLDEVILVNEGDTAQQELAQHLPDVVHVSEERRGHHRMDCDDDDNDSHEHDQLPDIEEYKVEVEAAVRSTGATSQRQCRMGMLLTAAFIMVATISIATGVILGRDTAPTTRNGNDGTSSAEEEKRSDDATGSEGESEGRTRREQISIMSKELGWSDPSTILQANTAQYAAASWMADLDPLQLEIKNSEEFRQRYALVVMYYSFQGDLHPWYDGDLPWLNGDPVCKWFKYYPTTTGEFIEMGVRCRGGSVVKELFLPRIRAVGEIPDEIKLLSDLETLYLYGNSIQGQLPSSIASLESLKVLDLHGNDLDGTFPEYLGNMKLQMLSLANNLLTGSLPETLEGLSSLETLDIGHNNIADDIQRLSVLKNVEYLDIANNSFSGIFGSDLLSNWHRIEVLDLSDNHIKGLLPDNLFEMSSLDIVDLHGNGFNGTLPQRVKPGSEMSFLALHENDLKGSISIVTQNLTQLKHLDLSGNWFDGPMDSLEKMSNLQYLSLAFNPKFQEGPIPSISKLSNLVDLSLKQTARTGSLPDGFGSMSGLVLLDLSFNQLVGTIPEDLGAATALQYLFLNRNKLAGSIPESFSGLTKLQTLLIDRNELKGQSNAICENKPEPLGSFIADCDEINCPTSCCTECCLDSSPDAIDLCEDLVWDEAMDPVAEYKSKRSIYVSNNDNIIYPTSKPQAVDTSTEADPDDDGP